MAVPATVVSALRAWRIVQIEERLKLGAAALPDPDGHVFTGEDDGPIDPRRWNAACKKAGVEPCRFHDARHTAATAMLGAGIDIFTVSRCLGHQDISVTARVYGHLTVTMQSDAAAKLDAFLWGT